VVLHAGTPYVECWQGCQPLQVTVAELRVLCCSCSKSPACLFYVYLLLLLLSTQPVASAAAAPAMVPPGRVSSGPSSEGSSPT
jgi:hypothetical protein